MHLYLTDEEMMELDKKHYIEIGEEKGRQEKEHEMIINLHNNNASLELISKSTGLSIKEIEKIIENNK